jgi:hypothetical protein
MPECRTLRHLVSPVLEKKQLTLPKPVKYQSKLTIFLVRYRTEIMDDGMPMPALVSSMPMPSYGYARFLCYKLEHPAESQLWPKAVLNN